MPRKFASVPLRGIPDSMDVVSIWGGKTGLSKEQKADMKEVLRPHGEDQMDPLKSGETKEADLSQFDFWVSLLWVRGPRDRLVPACRTLGRSMG